MIELILSLEFDKAIGLLLQYESVESGFKEIFEASVSFENIIFYTFYISLEERFKNNSYYYMYMSTMLGHVFNYLKGAYNLAAYYCEKAIAMDSDNKDFRDHYDYLSLHL